MPEGVAVAGGRVVSGAVHDNPEIPPAPGPEAPKGWTWNRNDRVWQPKQRGPVIWVPAGESPAPESGGGYPWFHGDQQRLEEPPAPETLGRDPAPGWMSAEQPQGKHARRLTIDQVPQQVQDDISGLAGLVGTPILAVLRSIDPYCGGALADAYADVLDATLPLICRSERIVKYFSEDTADWLLWGKLAIALGPVGKAIAEHHIFRTVEVIRDEKTGVVSIIRTNAGGRDNLAQNLTPPAADPDLYAA